MIKISKLCKSYGKYQALKDVDLDIKDGSVMGLIGINGAGKSTTMNMITGFIEPTSGRILVDGYDISKKPKKAKKQIGNLYLAMLNPVQIWLQHSLLFWNLLNQKKFRLLVMVRMHRLNLLIRILQI